MVARCCRCKKTRKLNFVSNGKKSYYKCSKCNIKIFKDNPRFQVLCVSSRWRGNTLFFLPPSGGFLLPIWQIY